MTDNVEMMAGGEVEIAGDLLDNDELGTSKLEPTLATVLLGIGKIEID